MAKIRHIAILSTDHVRLARFCTEVLELEEVSRGGDPLGNTIYLTDGDINLAIIGAKEGRTPGVNHRGFLVDDLDKAKEKLMALEGDMAVTERPGLALHGQYFESKFLDPEGFLFDVSETSWPGTKETAGKAAEKT